MLNLIEGLWTIKFVSNTQSAGAGVIVIAKDKILGGDTQYMYVGSISIVNDIVNADVHVKIHERIPGGQSIFGPLEDFDLILTGKLGAKEMVLTGRLKENADAAITILCSKVAELPY
ncbi:MAG: GrlR family regulatory protein [Gammaproteobacteria bacterium]|nr:GrlR family regulatory protein [Gammaproteobacteria bacterium]